MIACRKERILLMNFLKSMYRNLTKLVAVIFVIAGCGSGRKIFRKLQRSGKAFFTGIISQNDSDYPSAKALATKIVEAEAFEPVPNELTETAKRLIDSCEKVICARQKFGAYEEYNRKLYEYALKCDKLADIKDI